MIAKETIEAAVSEFLAEKGLKLFKVTNNKENNIKIFISRPDGSVSIDDCVELSRCVEDHLDRDTEDYSLMVSSSGGLE